MDRMAGEKMRHILIFTVFFFTFMCASILISTPIFPGSLFTNLFSNSQLAEYSLYLTAIINGLAYSLLFGCVFVWVSKKLVQD